MRWFINSTKETSSINDHNNVQGQIGALHTSIDSQQKQWTNHIDRISDSLHNKGIQINNILKHQGSQNERIETLERNLQLVLRKIDDFLQIDKNRRSEYHESNYETHETLKQFENRVKALENQSVPKQPIPDAKPKESQIRIPKFRRMKNTYSDSRYAASYAIAHGYTKAGFNQVQIAGKLNALGHRTPRGMEFTERHVTDLMCNSYQKAKFLEGKKNKPKL